MLTATTDDGRPVLMGWHSTSVPGAIALGVNVMNRSHNQSVDFHIIIPADQVEHLHQLVHQITGLSNPEPALRIERKIMAKKKKKTSRKPKPSAPVTIHESDELGPSSEIPHEIRLESEHETGLIHLCVYLRDGSPDEDPCSVSTLTNEQAELFARSIINRVGTNRRMARGLQRRPRQ